MKRVIYIAVLVKYRKGYILLSTLLNIYLKKYLLVLNHNWLLWTLDKYIIYTFNTSRIFRKPIVRDYIYLHHYTYLHYVKKSAKNELNS